MSANVQQSIEGRLIQFIVDNANHPNHPKLPTQTIVDRMQSRRAGAEDICIGGFMTFSIMVMRCWSTAFRSSSSSTACFPFC